MTRRESMTHFFLLFYHMILRWSLVNFITGRIISEYISSWGLAWRFRISERGVFPSMITLLIRSYLINDDNQSMRVTLCVCASTKKKAPRHLHSARRTQCTAHTGCTTASEASDQHLCVCFTPPVSSNLLCTLYTWPLLSETKIDPIATCVFVTSLLLCHPLHKFGDSSLNQMIFNIICPSTSPQLTDQPLEIE